MARDSQAEGQPAEPDSNEPVEPFLERAATAGQYDSTGVFTTNVSEGLGKLGFQLPDPSMWILKVIQSGVAAGASELRIAHGRKSTEITLHGVSGLCVRALHQALASTDPSDQRSLNHLVGGLRSVGMASRRTWRLAADRDQFRQMLSWDGRELEGKGSVEVASDDQSQGEAKIILEVDYPRSTSSPERAILIRQERQQVSERAQICPVPLSLGRARMDRFRGFRWAEGVSSSYLCLGISPADWPRESCFPLPSGLEAPGWRPADRFSDGRPFFVYGSPKVKRTSALWRLCYHYKINSYLFSQLKDFHWDAVSMESRCHWIQDGVVCQIDRLRDVVWPVSLELYLSAEGLATDLSGLTLRGGDSDAMADRFNHALKKVRASLRSTCDALAHHYSTPFTGHTVLLLPLMLGSLVGAVFVAPVIGVAALFGGANLVTSASNKQLLVQDCLATLKQLRDTGWPEDRPKVPRG